VGPAWCREDSACADVDPGDTNFLCGCEGNRDSREKKEFHILSLRDDLGRLLYDLGPSAAENLVPAFPMLPVDWRRWRVCVS
jgi:hypothetical protein